MKHTCHAHACTTPVHPSMLMCRAHWAKVPNALRFSLLRAYRRGQCTDRRPSAAYMAAQRACVAFVARAEGHARAADYYAEKSTEWAARAQAEAEEKAGAA